MRWSLFLPLTFPCIALLVMTRTHVAASREVRRPEQTRPVRDAVNLSVDPSRKSLEANSTQAPHTDLFRSTFFHMHTLELLPVAEIGELPTASIEHFLRCRVTGSEHAMDPTLVPLAISMASHFHQSRIEVISGFRSEKLNELLRKKGHQVARDSQHTHGTALDFRIPGVNAAVLAVEVARVHVGGIGIYTDNNFVHADSGRPRRWSGR